MKKYLCLLLLVSAALSSCAKLNEDFDCPAPKGGSCQRMDEIYEMVNGMKKEELKPLAVKPKRHALIKQSKDGKVLAYEKGVMPLWIAPYEDTDGNYREANRVYSYIEDNNSSSTTRQG